MGREKSKDNLLAELAELGIRNTRVLEAFHAVPREDFISKHLVEHAYENSALPIGHEQTISQPYTVARMMELLDPQRDDVILEIGTGSGYQAALLSNLVKSVYTIERIPQLAKKANAVFKSLGLNNIVSKIGDGSKGLPDYEPYNGIIVTAGASLIPEAYLDQLAEGGRLVIPVGNRSMQIMVKVVRQDDAYIKTEHGNFMFVPLIREC